MFSPFKQSTATKRKRDADPPHIRAPTRLRRVHYMTETCELTTAIPPAFPSLFHELITAITEPSNTGDIRNSEVSALVLVPPVNGQRPPKLSVTSHIEYSSIECKISDATGAFYRVYVLNSSNDTGIESVAESMIQSRPGLFIALLNYHIHLHEIEPLIKRLRDKNPPAAEPRKISIPPTQVYDVVKEHLSALSQSEQREIIKTLQLIPANASSPDFLFQIISHAVSQLSSQPDESIRMLRSDLYKPAWSAILDIVRKLK